jgi:hypothetical protein
LNFLVQTSQGIKASERASLRARISSFEKLDSFELSETDIKAGIRILERNNFRKKFRDRTSIPTAKRSRLKLSTLIVLILAGSVVIAITVPQIRHSITHFIQEIFSPKEENQKSEGSLIQSPLRPDTAITNNASDSLRKPTDSLVAQNQPQKKVTPLRLYNSGKIITAETYRQHFRKHKKELEKIEGVWNLSGKFKGYGNPVQMKCAIRKIEVDKFELVFFDPSELLWNKLTTKYYLQPSEDNSKFIVLEYVNKRSLSSKSASLSKGGKLVLQNSFILSEFNVKTENVKERVLGNFTGSKETLNNDSAH